MAVNKGNISQKNNHSAEPRTISLAHKNVLNRRKKPEVMKTKRQC